MVKRQWVTAAAVLTLVMFVCAPTLQAAITAVLDSDVEGFFGSGVTVDTYQQSEGPIYPTWGSLGAVPPVGTLSLTNVPPLYPGFPNPNPPLTPNIPFASITGHAQGAPSLMARRRPTIPSTAATAARGSTPAMPTPGWVIIRAR